MSGFEKCVCPIRICSFYFKLKPGVTHVTKSREMYKETLCMKIVESLFQSKIAMISKGIKLWHLRYLHSEWTAHTGLCK